MNPQTNALPSKQGAGRFGFRFLTYSLFGASTIIEILVLILMETSFGYQKQELIKNQKRPLDEINRELPIYSSELTQVLENPRAVSDQDKQRLLTEAFGKVVNLCEAPDFPVVMLQVASPEGKLFAGREDPHADEKMRRFNTWKNCFLSRNFIYDVRSARPGYELRVHFVSFPDMPDVEELLLRFRFYAVLFTLGNALFTGVLFWGAIRPLGRIANALSRAGYEPAPLIDPPKHMAERVYNSLARGTRLSNVNAEVGDLYERVGEVSLAGWDSQIHFWRPALTSIVSGMGYRKAAWIPFEEEGPPEPVYEAGDENLQVVSPEEIKARVKRRSKEASSGVEDAWIYQEGNGTRGRKWFVGNVSRREEIVGFLVATVDRNEESVELDLPYFKALTDQLGFILTRALERQEAMDRDRFEVSIDLSASMGHDLTNILATGRLELETVRTAYKRGILKVDEGKRRAVEAAIEGIRKTTVLLQEVVNVYRAFSYTREPRSEDLDLNELMREVIELYRHSTSRDVVYDLLNPDEKVVAFADPRLLKLVLFNLLANATQSIGQRQAESPDPRGKVDIDCRIEEGWPVVRVTDNGTGFQDPRGHRLEGVELQQIFQFDFTTKSRKGGLGLAWVRSIIEDIHHGRLVPANRADETGAVMEVYLPPREGHDSKDAKL
jgi:signal transduction histidine kinase